MLMLFYKFGYQKHYRLFIEHPYVIGQSHWFLCQVSILKELELVNTMKR
jgi:hypothetical protein